jgi:hypothetical protein
MDLIAFLAFAKAGEFAAEVEGNTVEPADELVSSTP